jgi:flagellar basal body-associated protein FliL
MTDTVSKATIMVLLVLTIIVSVLSTIIILDRAEQLQAAQQFTQPQQPATGKVSMTIVGGATGNVVLEPDSTNARVSININER